MTQLSVLITSLPFSFAESLRSLSQIGFHHVDLVGSSARSSEDRESLAESGLIVDCVALGRDLPTGCALDALDLRQRQVAVEEVTKQLIDAAQLGARFAYVVPTRSVENLPAFADACEILAQQANNRMIRFCIEHFPGSALPTVTATLDWLKTDGLENVKLLLDLGHCLISKEDPRKMVALAGDRLGYVQLDDNDASNDVHWPLLTGALTEGVLLDLLRCLREDGFLDGIALELNGKLDDALGNVVRSKQIVERLWQTL